MSPVLIGFELLLQVALALCRGALAAAVPGAERRLQELEASKELPLGAPPSTVGAAWEPRREDLVPGVSGNSVDKNASCGRLAGRHGGGVSKKGCATCASKSTPGP